MAPSSRSSGTRDEPLRTSASAEPKWLPALFSNVQGRIQKVQKVVAVALLGPPLNPPEAGNIKYSVTSNTVNLDSNLKKTLKVDPPFMQQVTPFTNILLMAVLK